MIKLKIAQIREQFGFEELSGDIETRTAKIKSAIFLFKAKYGYLYQNSHQTSPERDLTLQNHEHKAESEHSVKPSLDPSERLRASLSSRNAGRT